MKLGDEVVGHVTTKGRQVSLSEIAPKFRGMGLGKKMYGEVMRRMPKQQMASDTLMTDASTRVWRGMPGRGGYTMMRNPKLQVAFDQPGTLRGKPVTFHRVRPHFKANLPEEAALPGPANIDPTLREQAAGVGMGALGLAGATAPIAVPAAALGAVHYLESKAEKEREAKKKPKAPKTKPVEPPEELPKAASVLSR
jgi:hypothetical protein